MENAHHKNNNTAICRYFQQGCCHFGANCRFQHVYGQKYTYSAPQTTTTNKTEQLVYQVVSEISKVLKSGQWLMSCYGPISGKPCMPGLDDISPEEMRLSIYEARNNGTLDSTNIQIENYCKNVIEKLKLLTKPKAAFIKAIESLSRGEIPSDPFIKTDSGSGAININNTVTPQWNSTHIFGSQNTDTSSSNLFAKAAKALFQDGSNDNNIFGHQNSQSGNNNSPFSTQLEPSPNGGPFGSSEVFSGLNQNSSAFGSNFNQNAFCNLGNSMSNPSSQIFSETINNIPQPNQIFGQPTQQTVSATTLFGEANAKLQQSQMMSKNVFEYTNNVTSDKTAIVNPFQSSSPFTTSAPTNVFGNNPFNNNFVNQNAALQIEPGEGVYSDRGKLSEQDILAFESTAFQHGFIPEIAPSVEYCT